MKDELKVLEIVNNELNKILKKYDLKAEKEREKINNVYVTIKGDKYYSAKEIDELIEADILTSSQANRYIEKLEHKQAKKGMVNYKTESERVCTIIRNIKNNIITEIFDIKNREFLKQGQEES